MDLDREIERWVERERATNQEKKKVRERERERVCIGIN